MAYRKMTEGDLKALYTGLRRYFSSDQKYPQVVKAVELFFGVEAASVLIQVDSEYNDEYYNHSVGGIFVYDENDVELSLTMDARREFIQKVKSLNLDLPESEDAVDDIVLYLSSSKLPEVYVKE